MGKGWDMKIDLNFEDVCYIAGLLHEVIETPLDKIVAKEEFKQYAKLSKIKARILLEKMEEYLPKGFIKKHGGTINQIITEQRIPIEMVNWLKKCPTIMEEHA